MGNTLTAPSFVSTQQDLPTLLLDVPAYLMHQVLGGGKIFRTLQCIHEDGYVVLKLYVRRSSDFDLRRYEARLEELTQRLPLSACPSLLHLVKLEISDRCVFLARQSMGSNLVDRFQNHPSLSLVERQWLTFQMLHALLQLHSHGVRHGDIHSENFLLTSWSWLFLVDIAFYKPTFLPADNPADYSFFFENQGRMGSHGMITQTARRRCYLAPERFYSAITERKFQEPSDKGAGGSDGQVSEAMDVFSLGCVIAELFLNGETVLFDLPQLLAYREGLYDPSPTLARLPDSVRGLVAHMIQRDPAKRWGAKDYIKIFSTVGGAEALAAGMAAPQGSPSSPLPVPQASDLIDSLASAASSQQGAPPLFPPYFPFLYRFFAKLLSPDLADADIKIQALNSHGANIVREVLGREYVEQQAAEGERKRKEEAGAAQKASSGDSAASAAAAASAARSSPPPSSSSSSASAPFSTPPRGAHLLEELSAFRTSLTAKTEGLRSIEQLQADASEAALRAKERARAALVVGRSASSSTSAVAPSSSPALSPAAAPSAASLLDLASASSSRDAPPGEFSLETPAAAASSAVAAQYHGNGLTMITSIVCSCLQNVRYPITKLTALELLADFGSYVDDEIRLGRLVPYAVALLADPSSMVRSTACHILTKLLSQVTSINSGSDGHLFQEYIFPALSRFPSDPEEIVKLAYAQCIAELAASSKRFLDLAQFQRQVASRNSEEKTAASPAGSSPSPAALASSSPPLASPSSPLPLSIEPFDGPYSHELGTLQDTVLKLIIDMLTLGGSRVKRALLADITRLCVFMGRKRVNNDLLPHLITVLNDRDWQLRSAFFEYIVGVAVFVGRVAFQSFILPCIEQALFDVEEFVVQRAVHSLQALSALGLFEKRIMLDISVKVGPLLCHPSAWIRAETCKFVSSMAASLGRAKSQVFLVPLLRPFLRDEALATGVMMELTLEALVSNLKPHLTREEFRRAVTPAPKGTQPDEPPAAVTTNTTVAAPSRPVLIAPKKPAAAAAPSGFVAESYLGPNRLTAAAAALDPVWTEPTKGTPPSTSAKTYGTSNSTSRILEVDETSELESSVESVGPTGSGFRADAALFAVMSTYLARVSSAIQAKGLQLPLPASSASPANDSSSSPASLLARTSSLVMDEDSLLIDAAQASSISLLEEQIPLHQLDIEPTAPDWSHAVSQGGSGNSQQQQLERASQETFDSLGVSASSDRRNVGVSVRPGIQSDPSLIPAASRPGAAMSSGAALATAGATAQGGHPVPVRESLSAIPSYIKKALGVPLPPPQLGALRPDWVSQSAFYRNHPVLHTSPEGYASSDAADPKLWRPKGVLVATLTEHKHVRSLAVSRDNLFLVSGGDEGVVKIWDSQRLKLTAHARSQLTYVQQGRITSLCVCDSSHAVASASSNGSVHVFKVEYAGGETSNNANSNEAAAPSQRYIGLSDVKRLDPDPVSGEGSIQKVAHFNTLSESLLVYASQKAVHGWDLRSKHESLELKLEPSMGLLTAMDLGPSPFAMVTATARGFVTVWDLRFQIPVQVWRHSARTAITALQAVDAPSILPREPGQAYANGPTVMQYQHPAKGPLVFCAAEGTNQVAGFDVFTGESRMLLRVLNPTGSSSTSAASAASQRHGSISSPASNPSAALSAPSGGASSYPNRQRQKVRVSPLSLPSLRSYIRNDYASQGSQASSGSSSSSSLYAPPSSSSGFYNGLLSQTLDESFLSEFATMGAPEQHASNASHSITSLLLCKDSFAITAGTDKTVRFWDSRDPADSYRISSEDLSEGAYLRYNSRLENTTVVIEEVLSAANVHAHSSGSDADEKLRAKVALAKKHQNQGQVPPSTAHSSEILDVKALEFPQKMLASASRDGCIKIWI